jgi:pseudouridine kinase
MSRTVLCIGGLLLDELHSCPQTVLSATSNPTEITRDAGGVMGNVARQLGLLGISVELIAAVGFDPEADFLLEKLQQCSVQYPRLLRTNTGTGKFTAFLEPEGNLFAATCDDRINQEITPAYLKGLHLDPDAYKLIVADNNLPVESIQWLIDFSNVHDLPIILEPVSVPKVHKWRELDMSGVFMITPNEDEWRAFMEPIIDLQEQLLEMRVRGIRRTWISRGDQPSLWLEGDKIEQQPVISVKVNDSTGAGDASLAGWIAAWCMGMHESDCRKAAQCMASTVLSVKGSVHPSLTEQNFKNWMKS